MKNWNNAITQESWRILKYNAETITGFEKLLEVGPSISIFGSARTKPDDLYYKKTVEIALKAAASTKREIAVAGSVSTSGSWDKLTKNEIKPGFTEQLKILSDTGVDLIILEAMTSLDKESETILKSIQDMI